MNTIIFDCWNIHIFPKNEYNPIDRVIHECDYDNKLDCYKITVFDHDTRFIHVPEDYTFYIDIYYNNGLIEEKQMFHTIMFFKSPETMELYHNILQHITIDGLELTIDRLHILSFEDEHDICYWYEIDTISRLIRPIKPTYIHDCKDIFNYIGELGYKPIKNIPKKCIVHIVKPAAMIYCEDNEVRLISEKQIDTVQLDRYAMFKRLI